MFVKENPDRKKNVSRYIKRIKALFYLLLFIHLFLFLSDYQTFGNEG